MAKSKSKKGPAFDEAALEKLTSRIDDSLSKGDQQKRKKPHTTEVTAQDRKRQRKSSDNTSKQGKGSVNETELLLAEIKALGGDEDDLDLIQNAESEDEVVGQDVKKHPIDRSLKAELAKLSKELGFADYQPSEASEAETEEEEEEGDENDDGNEDGSGLGDEDEDEEEEIEDEEEPNGVDIKSSGKDKAEAQAKQQPRKIGNMVSSYPPSLAARLTTNTETRRSSSLELIGTRLIYQNFLALQVIRSALTLASQSR